MLRDFLETKSTVCILFENELMNYKQLKWKSNAKELSKLAFENCP